VLIGPCVVAVLRAFRVPHPWVTRRAQRSPRRTRAHLDEAPPAFCGQRVLRIRPTNRQPGVNAPASENTALLRSDATS